MDQFDHNPGLQGTPHELATYPTENPPTVGFLPLEAPASNMHQANRGTRIIVTPSPEPIHEGSGSSPVNLLDAIYG